MDNERLVEILAQLGDDGLTAFYVWLAVEYISLWALLGLLTWGCRVVWKFVKEEW